MSDINITQVSGRLGKNADFRELSRDKKMLSFSLCCSDYYKNKLGEFQERTTWFDVVGWGSSFEKLLPLLTKGRKVHVTGKMESREYEKDGQKIRRFNIVASQILPIAKVEVESAPEPHFPAPREQDNEDIPF